jgi:hypothetical protein
MNYRFVFFIITLISFQTLAQTTVSYEPENLGPNVNSEYEELSPIISPDGKTLYFVREGDPHNTKYAEVDDSQDIWYTELQPDGTWSPAKHMGAPLNKRKYNNILTVTPDGNTIMIRGAYNNGEYTGTGFSFCRKDGSGWTNPQMLGINLRWLPEFGWKSNCNVPCAKRGHSRGYICQLPGKGWKLDPSDESGTEDQH